MKSKIIIFLVILNLLLIVALVFATNAYQTEVYTFSGINNYIEVVNGSIVRNEDFEQVRCGYFRYINEVPDDTYKYTTKLYFMDGDKQVVLYKTETTHNPIYSVRVTAEEVTEGLNTNCHYSSYGKVARKLKDISRIDLISKLYLELVFTTTEEKEITQRLKMDVVPVEN